MNPLPAQVAESRLFRVDDFKTSAVRPEQSSRRENMPHPIRVKAAGKPIYNVMVKVWGDDVSGSIARAQAKHLRFTFNAQVALSAQRDCLRGEFQRSENQARRRRALRRQHGGLAYPPRKKQKKIGAKERTQDAAAATAAARLRELKDGELEENELMDDSDVDLDAEVAENASGLSLIA
ncbi:hypothetical protein PENSPDRAFT_671948 [Peniophora sp. CONT]|nr:hypothetical protein PENSPDRAFT_671948 [Peniophora sp. CONT]